MVSGLKKDRRPSCGSKAVKYLGGPSIVRPQKLQRLRRIGQVGYTQKIGLSWVRNCCLCQFSFCAGTSQEAVGSPSHGQPEKCRGAETKSMRPDMDRLMEMTFERNR